MGVAQVNEELDCRGLSCPIPILKTKKAIDAMTSGEVLKMTATDPGSVNDIDAWCRRTGNPLLDSETEGKEFIFYLQKK